MAIALTSEELDALWEESRQSQQTSETSDSFDGIEHYEKHPPSLAQGSGRFFQLRHGLSMSICKAVYLNDLSVHIQHSHVFPLTANFYIAGHSRIKTLHTKDKYLSEYVENAGKSYLYYLPDLEEIEECFAHQQRSMVKLWFTSEFLESFSLSSMDTLPVELQHLVQGKQQFRFYRNLGKMSSRIQTSLHQILNCPYQGVMKQLYLESHMMELLTLQIAQWMEEDNQVLTCAKLQPGDVERIYQAREILLQRLCNPPSLIALARQVGLNDRKLKQGFRQVFGTTVFGYLHNQRMEQARLLLLDNHLSVTAVAHSVGYTNSCAFSTAFRRKFGINPRALTKQLN
jgi:AraC family transcriptional regulator, transcriptional activator of the genes for pyochelin and ferripyochelin receptors